MPPRSAHGVCLWWPLLALLASSSALQVGTPGQVLAPFQQLNHDMALPDWVSPISHSSLGVINQRWWAWRKGELPEAWTDACFMSVTQGVCLPTTDMVEQWTHSALCRCGERLPSKRERFTVTFDLQALTYSAHDEVVYRTKAINELLKDIVPAMGPGAQVVNLGAGFDGRMFSLKELENATLFEMDLAPTIDLKRGLVERCGMKAVNGGHVHYLPLDIESSNVYAQLFEDKSFDPDRPTVFITEAVAQYLSESANLRSLRRLSHLTKNPKSRLIFMSWSVLGHFPVPSIAGDAVSFVVPGDDRDAAWFKDAGWEQALTMPQATVKTSFDGRHVPFCYINVFRSIPAPPE